MSTTPTQVINQQMEEAHEVLSNVVPFKPKLVSGGGTKPPWDWLYDVPVGHQFMCRPHTTAGEYPSPVVKSFVVLEHEEATPFVHVRETINERREEWLYSPDFSIQFEYLGGRRYDGDLHR